MTFEYNQLGLVDQVTDAVGTRTFSFDPDLLTLSTEAINTSGDPQLYYREITREYEPYTETSNDPPVQITGNTIGRPVKIQIGISGDLDRDYESEFFSGTTFGPRIRV